MDTKNIIKDSDPIRHDDLRELAKQPGPWASFVIPTHRGGAETLSDSRRLHPLLDAARAELAERFPDADADSLLSPVVALADSRRFWQAQCDGLAIFANPGGSRHFRLPRDFTPQVTVGEHPNLRTVLPLVADDLEFLLLALSQSSVRLFAADRATITPLSLGDIPASAEDVEGVSTREPQLQHQAGKNAPAHGHGPRDYNVLDGFLQAVGKAVESRFTGDPRPLILASVGEYHSAIKAQLNNVQLLDDAVAGNPDHLSELQLHEAAWPVAAAEAATRHEAVIEQLAAGLGTGLATNDPGLISRDSAAGRVQTLVLAERALDDETRAEDLDAAVANTLVNRGAVDVVPELPGGHAVGAVFRY